MIPLLRKFFTNEAVFERVVRGVVLGAGGVLVAQPELAQAVGAPAWIGAVLLGLAGMIHAGEVNAKD